ncbi:hypothetical protein L1049_020617 [Liquidambar formosana]|uniref:Pentatricopeptide repeat-containing protein n=1 Tax=Liquidambar formosana TaxID=63359 RepID=A0AAP0SDC3_LIQFO
MYFLPRLSHLPLLHLKTTSIHHIKQLHAQLITKGLKSPTLFAKLIDRYCAVSATNHAHQIFAHFDEPHVYLFNTLIRCTLPRTAILVFANWVSRGDLVFDDFTYIFLLGACARSSSPLALWEGKQIHSRIIKHGIASNVLVQTTAIHFYASNKDVSSARRVFDEMGMRTSVTWNAMMTGYCSQRERASCYARHALMLFKNMLVDVCGAKPTDTTMVCVLSAASQLGVLETGVCVHGYIEKTILGPENDVFIGTGLVDMYSKCGCLSSAFCIFWRMREKNVLTWTAMMTGLAIHGKGKEALELLHAMEGHNSRPNAVTFTSLFSACCHSGLVDEGLHLFQSMRSKFGVTPTIHHYGCIVDLLGKAGLLKEAYEFIMDMPVEPDAILWRSLLSACKVHGDAVMGEKVGKLLLQLQSDLGFLDLTDTSEDYVALSNVYASAEKWEDVEMVREVMKVKGIETKPGCSSVQCISHHCFDGL